MQHIIIKNKKHHKAPPYLLDDCDDVVPGINITSPDDFDVDNVEPDEMITLPPVDVSDVIPAAIVIDEPNDDDGDVVDLPPDILILPPLPLVASPLPI